MNRSNFRQKSAFVSDPSSKQGLREERAKADTELKKERELVDETLRVLQSDQENVGRVRAVVSELIEHIRIRRKNADDIRAAHRTKTDSTFSEQRFRDDAVQARTQAQLVSAHKSLVDERTQYEEAVEELRVRDIESHRTLWLVMAELDLLASLTQGMRLRALDVAEDDHLLALTNTMDIAIERLLVLVGDLLDPTDNRGSYHDIGGSG